MAGPQGPQGTQGSTGAQGSSNQDLEFGTQLTVSALIPQFIGTGGFNSSQPVVPRLINTAQTITRLTVGVDSPVATAMTCQVFVSTNQGVSYAAVGSSVVIPAAGRQATGTFAGVPLNLGDRVVIQVSAVVGGVIGGFTATVS